MSWHSSPTDDPRALRQGQVDIFTSKSMQRYATDDMVDVQERRDADEHDIRSGAMTSAIAATHCNAAPALLGLLDPRSV